MGGLRGEAWGARQGIATRLKKSADGEGFLLLFLALSVGRGKKKTRLRGRGDVEPIVTLKTDLTCLYL